MHPKKRTKPPPQKTETQYTKLWNIVDGAVLDAINCHPDYLNPQKSRKTVRASINKRVVGAVLASLRK